jgi:hypothetical protein
MREPEALDGGDVPHVRRVYLHNGEVFGVTPEGEMVILATIAEEGAPLRKEAPKPRDRSKPAPPKKKRGPDLPPESTSSNDTPNLQTEGKVGNL